MGLAASQSRLMMLMQRKSDIQFQVQTINQRRLTLANSAANMTRAFADQVYQTGDWTPYSATAALPGVGAIMAPGGLNGDPQTVTVAPIATSGTSGDAADNMEAQLSAVHAQDKELELRQKQLDTEYKCLEAEVDAVQKVIDKSIEKGFKTLG